MSEFITGNENEIIRDSVNLPIAAAFAVVESERGFMLLYNKYRGFWELTDGMREPGESPEDCVIRECREECNQEIENLKFIGIAKYETMNAAIYYSFLYDEKSFIENDEILKMHWFESSAGLTEVCGESIKLIKIYDPGFN